MSSALFDLEALSFFLGFFEGGLGIEASFVPQTRKVSKQEAHFQQDDSEFGLIHLESSADGDLEDTFSQPCLKNNEGWFFCLLSLKEDFPRF
jgi:hypothetical protein